MYCSILYISKVILNKEPGRNINHPNRNEFFYFFFTFTFVANYVILNSTAKPEGGTCKIFDQINLPLDWRT